MVQIIRIKDQVITPGGNNLSDGQFNILQCDMPNNPSSGVRSTRIKCDYKEIDGLYVLHFASDLGTGIALYVYQYVGPNETDYYPISYVGLSAGSHDFRGKISFGVKGFIRMWSNESSDITLSHGLFLFPEG